MMAQNFLRFINKNPFSVLHQSRRWLTTNLSAHKLGSQGLVQISGADSTNFLQGLITNDVIEFKHSSQSSMYAFLLNSKGRIFCDLILHKQPDESFLLECDKSLQENFVKNISRYKIRKKVNLKLLSDDFSVWAVFPNDVTSELDESLIQSLEGPTIKTVDPSLSSLCQL